MHTGRLIFAAIAGVVLLGASSRTDAAFVVTVDDGTTDWTITDQDFTGDGGADPIELIDANPLTGGISFTGTFGDWDLTVIFSTSKTITGTVTEPNLVLNVSAINMSGVESTLSVSATDTGFSSEDGLAGTTQFLVTANSANQNSGTVSVDAMTDGIGASDLITFTGVGGGSDVETLDVDGDYSLTLNTTLTNTGGGTNVGFTSSVTAIPEPASMALLATALPFGAMALRRRRNLQLSA